MAVCAAVAVPAQVTITTQADDVATVQPGGPRGGSGGKTFFNIEGSANGTFASFGVADFVFDGSDSVAGSLTALSLEIVQSNAGFTTNGRYSVYVTDATDVSIQSDGPLAYQGTNDGIASVDPQLTNLQLLGDFDFNRSCGRHP